jgi:hypothetical protein
MMASKRPGLECMCTLIPRRQMPVLASQMTREHFGEETDYCRTLYTVCFVDGRQKWRPWLFGMREGHASSAPTD